MDDQMAVYILLEQQLCKNMFKVVLVLKQISIRLKECELDVILRKNKENVVLCSKVHLANGACAINSIKEFYVDVDDSNITLVLYLFLGSTKRFGGEVVINVFEWEENVIQSMQSKINNCPDKNSWIKFQFYYFKDDKISDRRPFFMSTERYKEQYNLIQRSNKVLNEQKLKLEEEAVNWNKKNQMLEFSRQNMIDNMNLREINHQNQKGNYKECISQYSVEFEKQKQKREGLTKLAEEYGLNQSEWSKQQ